MSAVDFRLYVITNRHLCQNRSVEDVIAEACAAGVKAVQLREKDLDALQMFELAKRLKAICAAVGGHLFVNDRVDVAAAVEAHGVHLTARSLPADVARRVYAGTKFVAVSTHAPSEIRRADVAGADFALFGPVFATPSKARYGSPQGLERLREAVRAAPMPVFAVGGITPEGAAVCLENGAAGVAVMSAVMGAEDVTQAVRAFEKALGRL